MPPHAPPFTPRTLIITNGNQGSDAQAIGLTQALGVKARLRHVHLPPLFAALAPWGPAPPRLVGLRGKLFRPPWPELLIAVGRHAMPFAQAVRRAAGGATFAVALQDPKTPLGWWDLIWAPAHDGLTGENVVVTLTSPHRLTPQRLTAAAEELAGDLANLPRPRIAVLVGGPNGAFTFGMKEAAALFAKLDALAPAGAFLITTSRRTDPSVRSMTKDWADQRPSRIWNGGEPNPYLGFLGAADAIVVTADSVNMAGEAASTGKPVYLFDLPGKGEKFRRFHAALAETGALRPLEGAFAPWTYPAIDANREIAEAVKQAYQAWRSRLALAL